MIERVLRNRHAIAVVVVAILTVAAIGFLRGTDEGDYDLERSPLQVALEDPAAPRAQSYAEARAHTTRGSREVATACIDCHAERLVEARSGARTEHPVGVAVPRGAHLEALVASGARFATGSDQGVQVDCRTCHTPHTETHDARLVVSADDGTLCLSCHGDHGAAASEHPVATMLTENQRARIAALGGTTDEGGLTCLSCHDPHEAVAGTLLRTQGAGDTACVACHTSEHAMKTGGHREETCTDCHGMHEPADLPDGERQAGAGPALCLDCHTGAEAEPRIRLGVGHPLGTDPEIACTSCHDAHGATEDLLVDDAGKLCSGCHDGEASVVGTDHAPDGNCLTCHEMHDPVGRALVRSAPSMNPASGRCLACHDGSTEATKVVHGSHPKGLLLTTGGLPFRYAGPVPYYDAKGEPTTDRAAGEIACVTCHDPHRWKHDALVRPGLTEGSEQDSFLRDPDQVTQFCAVCHGVDARPRFRFYHSDQYRDGQP